MSSVLERSETEIEPVKLWSKKEVVRCRWAQSPLLIAYHDNEWGVPVHDDRQLFEFLILEGAQAGLSWETILKKRENYRRASMVSMLPKSRVTTAEKLGS